ncbi:MAG: hypothetical protein HYZ45_13040 [Burkholderiales bacterium]|nr:hypothetical protein [Burkholderiales bacterium]
MLIRADNDELVEYPDDLIAMMLAAPVVGDKGGSPNLSIAELHCLVHGMIGMLSAEGHTLEQNIENIREYCSMMGSPEPANLEKARAQITFYNENLTHSEIGYSDRETLQSIFPFQQVCGKADDAKTIDLAQSDIKNLSAN